MNDTRSVNRWKLQGLCTSCGISGRMYTCSICGGQFCINCIDIQKKLCKSGLKFKE